jgi:hypothetical protein
LTLFGAVKSEATFVDDEFGEENVWLDILFGFGLGFGELAFLICEAGSADLLTTCGSSRLDPVNVLPNSALRARPSGTGCSSSMDDVLITPFPSAWAFLKSSFFLRIASLNSSFRSDFWGPFVTARAAFPRMILFFSSSGAT